MRYNGTMYYYVFNVFGDITHLLDSSGNIVVEYQYDSYGNITSMTNSTLARANPYRYRGYRYDEESGLYYLNARYYDPEIGRFISADSLLKASDTVLGHNMFAYTENNPIVYVDETGNGVCLSDASVDNVNGPICQSPSGSRGSLRSSSASSGYYSQIKSFISNLDLTSTFSLGYFTANLRADSEFFNSFLGGQVKFALLRIVLEKDIGDFYVRLVIYFGALELKYGLIDGNHQFTFSASAVSGRLYLGGKIFREDSIISWEAGVKFSLGSAKLTNSFDFKALISMIGRNMTTAQITPYIRINIKFF